MIVFDEQAFQLALKGINIDNELAKSIITEYINYYNQQIVDELSEYPDELSKL